MQDWKLVDLIGKKEIEFELDDSGVYTLINRVLNDCIRVDVMNTVGHIPMMSFMGEPENVRKHVIEYLYAYDISIEHASYIGSEIAKASLDETYVQG